MIEINGKYCNAFFTIDQVEEECISQVVKLTNHYAFREGIVLMPDCHAGKGSCIGFTMPLGQYVIPNVIGVDIGCGMLGRSFNMKNLNLEQADNDIRAKIPFGMNIHENKGHGLNKESSIWGEAHLGQSKMFIKMREKFGLNVPAPPLSLNLDWYQKKCEEIGMNYNRAQMSIGTLGGGNHFIELGVSTVLSANPQKRKNNETEEKLWVIIHSGSRNLGKTICDYHQGIARNEYDKTLKGDYKMHVQHIKDTAPRNEIGARIKTLRENTGMADGISMKGLEVLTGKPMYNYLYDMIFAQYYASLNRAVMMNIITETLGLNPASGIETIETIHNYISTDDLIIRKGAIASYQDTKMIIPFNMAEGSWICKGKNNLAWNFSAPHGAGRAMSRTKAKAELNKEEATEQMKNIYTSCIPIDEAPNAYKSASFIQDAIRETATIEEKIKPIMNLKAN